MAALDFGMALARGMLPTSEKAQKDLLDLAGGRNVFKSEDWWNKTVDKQIKEGYRQEKMQTEYLVDTGLAQAGVTPRASGITKYRPGSPGIMGITIKPKGAIATRSGMAPAQYITREVSLGFQDGRKDFTAGELSDIERGAKRGAEAAKRTAAETKQAKKRLRRGTGGLLAKAATPEETGLPALGEGGLGYTSTMLGQETKL